MYSLLILASLFTESTLIVTSSSFNDGGLIPVVYTCSGNNISPELSITEVPKEAKTLAVIMYDPDAPGGNFDHWVSFDITPAGKIKEDAEPGVKGLNGKGTIGYTGPCPPSGTHHYHFKVYALDSNLNLKEGASRKMVEDAMAGHIIASGVITGLYKKK